MCSGLSQAIKDDIVEMKNDVREAAKGVVEMRMSQECKESHIHVVISSAMHEIENGYPPAQMRRDIITWISPLNFSRKQNDIFARRQEGTGEWLLERDEFKNWREGTERTLWCPGIRMTFPLNILHTVALY